MQPSFQTLLFTNMGNSKHIQMFIQQSSQSFLINSASSLVFFFFIWLASGALYNFTLSLIWCTIIYRWGRGQPLLRFSHSWILQCHSSHSKLLKSYHSNSGQLTQQQMQQLSHDDAYPCPKTSLLKWAQPLQHLPSSMWCTLTTHSLSPTLIVVRHWLQLHWLQLQTSKAVKLDTPLH